MNRGNKREIVIKTDLKGEGTNTRRGKKPIDASYTETESDISQGSIDGGILFRTLRGDRELGA